MSTKRNRRRTQHDLEQIDRGLAEWPDRGCTAWPSCLTCPLRRCIHEMPGARFRAVAAALRTHRRHTGGEPLAQILADEGISLRTFYRHLAAARAVLEPS